MATLKMQTQRGLAGVTYRVVTDDEEERILWARTCFFAGRGPPTEEIGETGGPAFVEMAREQEQEFRRLTQQMEATP